MSIFRTRSTRKKLELALLHLDEARWEIDCLKSNFDAVELNVLRDEKERWKKDQKELSCLRETCASLVQRLNQAHLLIGKLEAESKQ